jgi:hypothetical protein
MPGCLPLTRCPLFIGNHVAIGEWDQLSKTVHSIIVALFIGLLWRYLFNNDRIHKFLRKTKITNKISYPSEWYGTFTETKRYIILDLKDERRIMGWPAEWPNDPEKAILFWKTQNGSLLIRMENQAPFL